MKVQQAVKVETRKIASGVFLLSVIMVIVFAILGYFDYTVPLGTLLGALGAIGNFFFMAMTVQKITEQIHGVKKNLPKESLEKKEEEPKNQDLLDLDEAEEEDPLTPEEEADLREQTIWAKKKMQRSYAIRMLVVVCIGVIGLKAPVFHPVAVLIPFLFPRIIIFITSVLTGKKGA